MTTTQPDLHPALRPVLDPSTHIGPVALTVADLARSVDFYENALGLRAVERDTDRAVLATPGRPLLELVEATAARPKPAGVPGLYHFAVLLPSRAALGQLLRRLIEVEHPIGGASDHLVSEAIYLSDPDGNGIEIYRDRSRETWHFDRGAVRMAVDPLDLQGIYDEGVGEWTGIAPGTQMGHVHLQVGDVEEARRFYVDLIGFDVMAALPGARFVSAGGYHHHIGVNSWQTRGAGAPPPGFAGLRHFVILAPGATNAVAERLAAAGVSAERDGAVLRFRDPWNNGIELRG
jgi:catechol 2,3-dioxygenase